MNQKRELIRRGIRNEFHIANKLTKLYIRMNDSKLNYPFIKKDWCVIHTEKDFVGHEHDCGRKSFGPGLDGLNKAITFVLEHNGNRQLVTSPFNEKALVCVDDIDAAMLIEPVCIECGSPAELTCSKCGAAVCGSCVNRAIAVVELCKRCSRKNVR